MKVAASEASEHLSSFHHVEGAVQRLRVDTEIHELCRRELCGAYRLGEYDHPPRAPHGALELAQAFVFGLRLGEQLAAPIKRR